MASPITNNFFFWLASCTFLTLTMVYLELVDLGIFHLINFTIAGSFISWLLFVFIFVHDEVTSIEFQGETYVQKQLAERRALRRDLERMYAWRVGPRKVEQKKEEIIDLVLSQSSKNHIDLHECHVDIAVEVTKRFLARNNNENSSVMIVTGYGKSGTEPKIRPAIERLLTEEGYKFKLDKNYGIENKGCLRVFLKHNP